MTILMMMVSYLLKIIQHFFNSPRCNIADDDDNSDEESGSVKMKLKISKAGTSSMSAGRPKGTPGRRKRSQKKYTISDDDDDDMD